MFTFYLRPQVTPFVILFVERDGSTYMISLLQEHPAIEAGYEQFSVMKQKGQSAAEQLSWAETLWTPPLVGKKAALGFKTKLVDVLDMQGFRHLLHEKKVKIVYMSAATALKLSFRVSTPNGCTRRQVTGTYTMKPTVAHQ